MADNSSNLLDGPVDSILSAPTIPEKPKKPTTFRAFGDVKATRKAVYDSVLDAATSLPPVSNKTHTLTLANVQYIDPPEISKAKHKTAVLTGESLGRRLRGDWELTDNVTGKVLDRRTQVLARVPHLTDNGTFVHNGNEYSLRHQARLLSGVFTRVQNNGSIESHVNLLSDGPSHRIQLDPDKGIFNVHVGQGNIPLLPLLQHLGATQQEMRAAWGDDLYARNYGKADASATGKLLSKFAENKAIEGETPGQTLQRVFAGMKLDPQVTRKTLGQPYDHLDKHAILAATRKVLAVSRGEEKPDDRDSLAFQRFLGPEDIFAERLAKDRAGVRRQLLFKATYKGHLQGMPSGALQKQLDSALLESGLASPGEEINPAEILDKNTQVTRMGEGGIGSIDAIPAASRSVQPSQFGFIDAWRTPESMRAGVDTYLAANAIKGSDGKLYGRFTDARTGQPALKTPQDLADAVVAFPGGMAQLGKRIPVMKQGRLTWGRKQDVDYVLPAFEHAFSPLNNLVPLKSMTKGQRISMAARMTAQALPLANPEAPLVQNAVPGTRGQRSYEQEYAHHFGAVAASKGGKVISTAPGELTVRYDDGELSKIELHDMLPYNSKTFLHQTPLVAPGQSFTAGQQIVRSNFTTPNGEAALGVNARVAALPWKGLNHEDAWVISESLAKKLTSVHAYQHQLPVGEKTKLGKNTFVSLFPAKHSGEVLKNVDARGYVKPGTTVQYGDPLILGAEERERTQNKLYRRGQPTFNDVSVTWDHTDPGVVTDVVEGKDGPMVVVKSHRAMQTGDKISGRHGNKGVVAEILSDAQMPADKNGQPYELLENPLGVISRGNPGQWAEGKLGAIAHKLGHPVKVEDFDANVPDRVAWTENLMRQHGVPDTEDVYDPVRGVKIPGVSTGMKFFMKLHHIAEDKGQGRGGGGYSADETPTKGGEHGCFSPKQRIMTHLGYMRIANICEQRLGVQVKTFSERLGEWVFRPVTNWFTYKANVADLVTIHTAGGVCEIESICARSRSCFSATKNHMVFSYGGTLKPAGEIKPGDLLTTWGLLPTENQWQFLLGTMLGDASASADLSECGFEHSRKQTNYIEWKKSVLSGLLPKQIDTTHFHKKGSLIGRAKGKIIYGRRVYLTCDNVVDRLRRLCYDAAGNKIISKEWLDGLSDLSVAVWVLDDGSITNRAKKVGRVALCGNIAIMGLYPEDRQILCNWFNHRYGLKCVVNVAGAISLTVEACKRMIDIIADWVPAAAIPKSKRFLSHVVAERQAVWASHDIDSAARLGKVPLRVTRVAPYKHDKANVKTINVYDFTVDETHTYIAGHALVSNSKRLSVLDSNALLSHGSIANLHDANSIRGQRNDDYWLQFMQGHMPRDVKTPMVYEKYLASLKAAGINVNKENGRLNIMALTDKDIDKLAEDRNIENGQTVDFHGGALAPIKGGLFDQTYTGGHHGHRFSAIKLAEPFPSPVMEDPIRRVLGLTQKKFEAVIGGQEQLDGQTGPKAIADALSRIDVDREIAGDRHKLKFGVKSDRDMASRKLGYLKSAKKLGIHPSDWVLHRAPVLPPQFRPVNMMSNGTPLVADPNFLYRELFEANQNLADMKQKVGDANVGDERLAVYNAFKAVTGLGDPITQQSQDKKVRGILAGVFGSSPKHSTLQRKLISPTVDNVGRAVITPDPDLDMDSVGLPEDRAFDVYGRFVVRRLKRSGMSISQALTELKNKTPLARKVLMEEMEHRPVIVNRAPVLHRFGIMAFRPHLSAGSTLRTPVLMLHGAGGDYDGDMMQYSVPVSEEARIEALDRMLPSRQLLSPRDFKTPVYMPRQEYQGGLFEATRDNNKSKRPVRYFRSLDDVSRAWKAGDIAANDQVVILDKK